MRFPGDTNLACLLLLTGCVVQSPLHSAMESGFLVESVTSEQFQHVVARRPGADGTGPVHVYIEGDGVPWFAGMQPSRNPTPKNALALRLAALDDNEVIYVGRPCYFGHHRDDGCDSSRWTSGRYSDAVVDSMVAAIEVTTRQVGDRGVVLIGYSGGGVLANLVADRLPGVRAVLTVAANLDIDAWTEHHGYEPLAGSINPAKRARGDTDIPFIQVIGGADSNVPTSVSLAYQAKHPYTLVWSYPGFDHACCWEDEWPSIVGRLYTFLGRPESSQLID